MSRYRMSTKRCRYEGPSSTSLLSVLIFSTSSFFSYLCLFHVTPPPSLTFSIHHSLLICMPLMFSVSLIFTVLPFRCIPLTYLFYFHPLLFLACAWSIRWSSHFPSSFFNALSSIQFLMDKQKSWPYSWKSSHLAIVSNLIFQNVINILQSSTSQLFLSSTHNIIYISLIFFYHNIRRLPSPIHAYNNCAS